MEDLRFGTKIDWELANKICCHNRDYAEPSGSFGHGGRGRVRGREQARREISHFLRDALTTQGCFLTPTRSGLCVRRPTLPCSHRKVGQSHLRRVLVNALCGRTMQEWYSESLAHGWPSFRDAEVVKEVNSSEQHP
eukprot:199447-Hanusia_phi.AAC.2